MGSSSAVNLSDIQEINRVYLGYVDELTIDDIQRRTAEVSIAPSRITARLADAREMLERFGLVIFPGAVPECVCDIASRAADDLYRRYAAHGRSVYEDGQAYFQVGVGKLEGYDKLSKYTKAVINVRQGQDQGMIDIFNCDLAIPEALQDLRGVFEDPRMLDLVNNDALRPRNLNIYLNESITKTRGFHVDSYSRNLKGFVYLTNVLSLEDGPYTYVKGSHVDSALRRANRLLCESIKPSTETPIVDPRSITPILAPKGSLVISDQSGSHRGWPQGGGHQRMVAVMKYS